ncbi:MAG TPA: DUF1501 domain-containing protein [Pirellulales bacterium]|nr:DUF1501 domain-containing protein [Pirellulales bacterium]
MSTRHTPIWYPVRDPRADAAPERFGAPFSRRELLGLGLAGALGVSFSGWLPRLAAAAKEQEAGAAAGRRGKSCILLWMNGGPSQTDTFDLKPRHANGGPYKEIATAAAGVRISEHLPSVAKQMKDLAIIRSLSTKEGEHGLATQLMLTGYASRQAAIRYPSLGSLLAKELGSDETDLPNFISLSPFRMADAGFLGPNYSPLTVSGASDDPNTRANLALEDLAPPHGRDEKAMKSQFDILRFMERQFDEAQSAEAVKAHRASYAKAMRMVETQARKAFQLDEEPAALRDAYGRNRFGQGCLLARRLVERGVAFVEVTLASAPGNVAGWDTHANNFEQVKALSQVLDPGWATLMNDLRDRELLESTLVIWMGEFGRTPKINPNGGRDHFPAAWSVVLGGARIKGGQALGGSGPGGEAVAERPVGIAELYATICAALGVDHKKENISPEGRPIPLVDRGGEPIKELVVL